MSKKTRKKSSKSSTITSARAKPGKSSAAKTPAKKAQNKASPKSTKASAAKAKAKAPVKAGRATSARAQSAAPSKSKPTATKAGAKSAPKAVTKTATKPPRRPLAPPPPAVVAPESIRHSGPLMEGMTIPDFKLPRDGGEVVPLAPKTGRALVIFFYPRADTPGCTKEAMDFSRLSADFDAANTDVVGISADPLKAQEAFRNKHELKVPLLSDEPHEILEAFGVWGEKSMYGKTFFGVLRTTVVVGPDRKIDRIWHHVKVDGHADEVLEYVKSR
jgi:peroxiredoxin Q/BCP